MGGATGQHIGPYIVIRALEEHAGGGGASYLAVLAEEERGTWEPGIEHPCYLLVEGAVATLPAAAQLVALGLRHPRLLAPRAVVADGTREYLAIETTCDATATLPMPLSAGARLSAEETLRAGVGLADALAYLHRNRVVRLPIAPETIMLLEGRAYLGGVERATPLEDERGEAESLFARDANALARMLEPLAGVPDVPPAGESLAQTGVREIAARGLVGGFTTAEEVGAACATALQVALQAAPTFEEDAPAERRLFLNVGSATSVGRVRSQNQDALAAVSLDVRDDIAGGMPLGVFLVADGMGGEAHGEIASRLAARVVAAEVMRALFLPAMLLPASTSLGEDLRPEVGRISSQELAEALVHAVEAANAQVRALSERLGQPTGTTLTAVAVCGAQAIIAHVGDSRAYLLHGETLMRLTEDHSLMARLEAMDHPLLHDPAFVMSRSILYRSLGQEDNAPPDLLDLPLSPGDRLMLCCDGLWDELDDQTIGLTLATAANPEACAQQLVDLANAAGGHDNSSAIVLFVEARAADEVGHEGDHEGDAEGASAPEGDSASASAADESERVP